ncbi:MAG: beta strand repeat-containing protein [Bdellovibrionales bacterium]
MSTYKARKNAAANSKFSTLKYLTTSALTAAGLLASGHSVVNAQTIADDTTPGFKITKGQGTVDTSTAGLEVINQNSHVLEAQAPKINLGANATLKILGQAKNDIFAGRATSRTGLSQLFGTVEANGIVVFTDPSGFIVGKTFVADVNSLILGTGELSIDELTEGDRFTFFNSDAGAKIEIHEGATINIAEAGLASFVAPTVKNAGTINARLGTVEFAAGESVTIDLYGDGLFEVEVDGELADAYLENTGTINAQGGVVQMTALAAKDVADNIINLDGVTDVSSATQVGGKIILSGGKKGAVTVKGKADASGKDGGEIEITGETVVADAGADIDASGEEKGGNIRFGGAWQGQGDTPTSKFAFIDQKAILRNNAGEGFAGGETVVWSDLATFFYGSIEAAGGRVETSGKDFLLSAGEVNADEWLLDPRNLEITTFNDDIGFVIGSNPNTFIAILDQRFTNTSQIDHETIERSLNRGTSVTLRTGAQDFGDGDIFVNAEITKTSGNDATLRLEAHDDIFVNQGIESKQGALNVELIAGALGNRFGDHDVQIDADIETNGGNVFASGHNIELETGADIITSQGDVEFRAREDIKIDDDITTAGGKATFIAGDDFEVDNFGDTVSTSGGLITVEANTFDLDGELDAGTGKVSLSRRGVGQIDIGDSNFARFRIDQNELNRITAAELVIGNAANNFDNTLRIDNANFSGFAQTTLNTRNNDFSEAQDALFQGENTAQALTVNADDDIRIASFASLETTGNVVFNTDTNEAGVGSFTMGTDATIDTNGNDLTVNTINVGLGEDAKIAAEGGNIDFNNTGVFSSINANSVSTNTEGTIQINQNGGTTAGASIQNAIDAIDNTGTGQNTLFTDASTYTENLDINQANLKIDGLNTLIQGVITVNQANFNLDPVTVDAMGNDYGLVADGIGANGLISDGNRFINAAKAGIFVQADGNSTGTIKNNIFEASATRGVETGTLSNGYTLNITDNNIGFFGAEVVNGLKFGRVQDANINITRGVINSSNDAITFGSGTRGTSIVTLTDVIAFAGDEALDVNGNVRGNSTFNVNRGTFIGAGNGLEFARIDGTVTLTDVASSSTERRGLNLLGTINGDLNVTGGVYTGIVNGIGTNNNKNNINGKVEITNTIVSATEGDGIEFAAVNTGGILNVKGTTVTAQNDGISLGLVSGAVNIGDASQDPAAPKTTTIIAGGDGITSDLAEAGVLEGGDVTIKNVDIDAGQNAIALKSIEKSTIANNIITAGVDGINVNTFGTTDISFNDIDNTGDDGIDVSVGNKVNIYNNFIDLAGFLPNGFLNIEVGQNKADGITVSDITAPIVEDTPEVAALAAVETGSETQTDTFEALVNIENNEIANVSDDGIDVQNSDSAFINNNTIGHVGDDGIVLDDVDIAMLRINKITLAEANGISVTGGEYAGIFENRILLAGDDGIKVLDVNGGQDTEVTGDVVYGEGWSVNIGGNQIALVGNDGIEVGRSFGEGGVGVTGPTNIVGNQIFGAGLGDALAPVIDVVNALSSRSQTITAQPAAVAAASVAEGEQDTAPESFGFDWGDGNGINVSGITGAINSPNGFAVNIEGNTVKYTGGNGIQVIGADRARISGINNVSYAGLDFTSFSGVGGMSALLQNGPLSRENAGRRDLWETEGNMVDVIDGYIGNETEQPTEPEYGIYVTLNDIEFGNSDGIYVEDVYSDTAEPNANALEIDNNIISFVGDDGIEVNSAGRTIISGNTITDAGFGNGDYYGEGDESGADGIHVENVSTSFTRDIALFDGIGRVDGGEPISTPIEELPVHERPFNFEADSEYALIIRGNTIERTGDDGIEVVGSGENYGNTKFGAIGISGRDYDGGEGENPRSPTQIFGITDRTLVTGNTISETGFEFANSEGGLLGPINTGFDGRGHDGIHVRNVTGTQIFGIISDEQDVVRQTEGYSGGLSINPDSNSNFYGYAVDIVKNEVQRTGDDGIEVDNSQSTLITLNTVSQAGVRDVEKGISTDGEASFDRFGLNTDGADISGADGIRVRNVGGAGAQSDWIGSSTIEGIDPYAVAIVTNDVSKTADDGIEIVGETSNNQMIDTYQASVAYDNGNDEAFQYNGTGRILIEGNTISDAGTSGQIISKEPSDGAVTTNRTINTGFAGSYDGRGGDGIHVNLAQSNNNINVWPVPTALSSASGLSTGGNYDVYEQPYDVQVIGNTIERTGDDGVEILGDDNNRLPIAKFGAVGLVSSTQIDQQSISRVRVEGNTISDSGVNAVTFDSERSRTETLNIPNIQGSEFELAIAINNETSTRTTEESTFGNAGQDGRGADAIHVSGVGQTNNDTLATVGSVGAGPVDG